MTKEELDALEALANAATPGPWLWGRHTFKTKDEAKEWISETFEQREGLELWMSFVPDPERPSESLFTAITGNGPHSEANAAFVAQIGDAVPKLIARVRELAGQAAAGALEQWTAEPPTEAGHYWAVVGRESFVRQVLVALWTPDQAIAKPPHYLTAMEPGNTGPLPLSRFSRWMKSPTPEAPGPT